jgi:hypothetical protein
VNRSPAWLVVAAVLALAGCSGSVDPDPAVPDHPAAATVAPTPFAPQREAAPAGFHVEQCPDLRARGNTGLAVRLVVPDEFSSDVSRYRAGCSFTADLDRQLYLDIGPMETLAAYTGRNVTPFESDEGDDSISGVRLVDDLPVFARTTGEQLDYRPYNDGLPLQTRIMQANGLRLRWDVPDKRADRYAEQLAVITSSVGLVESRRTTCAGQGRTATFVPPLPATDGIDLISGSRCFVYLRPRDGLLRHAEVDVTPDRSLAELAVLLESRPAIGEVTLEPGTATLDGEPADRLTWVLERTHNGFKGKAGTYRAVAVGTDDLQVTWSAEVHDWPADRELFRQLLDSVRSARS